MRRIFAGMISAALLPLPNLAMAKAKVDAAPVFDVARSCQEARAFAGDNKNLAYQGCMKDESDARAEIVRKWANFNLEDRRDCVAQGAEPIPSYVEILTCLEMSEQARGLYNPDGTARTRPDKTMQGLSGPSLAAPSNNSPNPAGLQGTEGVPKPEAVPPAPKPAQ